MLLQNLNHFNGERAYFLLGQLAELELALVEYTVDRLTEEFWFTAVEVPDMLPVDVIR